MKDLDYFMPKALLASSNTSLIDVGHLHGCACAAFGCQPIPIQVNRYVLRAQWERKTRSLSHAILPSSTIADLALPKSLSSFPHNPTAPSYTIVNSVTGHNETWYFDLTLPSFLEWLAKIERALPCVLIYYPIANDVSDMNEWLIRRRDCGNVGCAFAPIPLTSSFSRDTFCLPVSFNPNGPEPELLHFTMFLQLSPPKRSIPDGSVIRGSGSREVYLVENQMLRMFPNGDTFINMGYEWSQIQIFHQKEIDSWPKGSTLPTP